MSERATFAGGCFWGVEAAFRQIPGVIKTTAGYTGGTVAHPTYEQVSSGKTQHVEAVQIEFEPKKISFQKLLEHFWRLHDPTQVDRQGLDIGRQYRSTIFYHSADQKKLAQVSKLALEESRRFKKPIATEILPIETFYPAEEYHQRFLEKRHLATCTPELHQEIP